jgi:hypothetical protein
MLGTSKWYFQHRWPIMKSELVYTFLALKNGKASEEATYTRKCGRLVNTKSFASYLT